MSKETPASVIKRAASVPQPLALFIILDGIPYCEAAGRTKKEYDAMMLDWRKTTLPTLRRSNVRYFERDKTGAITEINF